jgi:hypothetical protein
MEIQDNITQKKNIFFGLINAESGRIYIFMHLNLGICGKNIY